MRWQRVVLSVLTVAQFTFTVHHFELWSRFGAVKKRVDGFNSDSTDDENDALDDDKIKNVSEQQTKGATEVKGRKRDKSAIRKPQNATKIKHDIHADKSTKVSWLMSFPNSGTSYTLLAIRLASNHLVASNYDSGANKDNPWPVYAGQLQGPHWSAIRTTHKGPPSKYILTKTHCGGYGQKDFVKDFASVGVFTKECLKGYYFVRENGKTRKVPTKYSADLVASAVHVIRNPLDNIVARFHLFRKGRGLKDQNDSREHFMQFCAVRDQYLDSNKHVPDFLKIPCRTEFFQYAMWHNMAFKTTKQLGIDTHILHYEKFSTNCTKTTQNILDFLELKWERKGKEFVSGKEYSHLYTDEEKKDIRFALQNLSSNRTWSQIRHYFES